MLHLHPWDHESFRLGFRFPLLWAVAFGFTSPYFFKMTLMVKLQESG
jgi:hypothetical protein